MDFAFFFHSVGLGAGLAMDAFSVSLANGLNERAMPKWKPFLIAGLFAFFQALMPLLGWVGVHTVLEYFSFFEKLIPWIALVLLLFIGGKMLIDGIREKEDCPTCSVGFLSLLVQGIATSIDALSVGFTIAEYPFLHALTCALIIGVITFGICLAGVFLGKKFGTKFAGKASLLGGIILIVIGIEIFLTGIFG
ncbi:MAG: manganese efflux pump [Clostridia bacterium]|nr:manganese efflux pump [Clostridia bacterium]